MRESSLQAAEAAVRAYGVEDAAAAKRVLLAVTESATEARHILRLCVHGIELGWYGDNRRNAIIISNLHDRRGVRLNAAFDAVESMVLAHFCAGIDVRSPAYLEGIETAVDAIENHHG